MNEARKSGKRAGRQNGSDQRVIFAVEWPKNRERSLRPGCSSSSERGEKSRTRYAVTSDRHKFQGDERDVMIFSPVVSEGITDGAVNFLKKTDNLFNVAITRARAA